MEFFGEKWYSWRDTGSGAKGGWTREKEEEEEGGEEEDVKEEVEEEVVEVEVEKKVDRGTERAMIRRDRAGSTCSSRYRAWINASL